MVGSNFLSLIIADISNFNVTNFMSETHFQFGALNHERKILERGACTNFRTGYDVPFVLVPSFSSDPVLKSNGNLIIKGVGVDFGPKSALLRKHKI